MKKFFSNILSSMIGTWIALAIVAIIMIGAIAVAVSSLGGSDNQSASLEKKSILKIDLKGSIEERETSFDIDFIALMQGKGLEEPQSLVALTKALHEAKTNEKISALYLDCKSASASPATLKALRNAVIDFKKSGKKVYAYGDYLSQGDYYVASVADSVFINPSGYLALSGMSTASIYMKDLFDKLGIEFQIAKVGTFKSAVEPFTQSHMSEPARAQLDTLTVNMWSIIRADIAAARKITTADIDSIMASNITMCSTPEQIKGWKLIDRCVVRREMDDILSRLVGVDKKDLRFASVADMDSHSDWGTKYDSKNQIAVLYAAGEIEESENAGINCEKLVPVITKLADDDNVKAMVLRVNSPGGSVFGSAEIAEALSYFQSKGKKLAVSMGDYAASGGYWISCEADRIFACPLTVTGSIGIFGMLPNGKGLLEKLGVNPQFVTTNQLSDIRIPLAPITDSQMAALQAEINRGYDKFINRVALGRHMPESKVRTIAEGRVWDGKKALELGLVDQLGTLEDAIAWVATTSKVDKDYDVVLYPKTESSFMDMVMSMTKTGLAPQMDQMLGKIEANPFLLAKGISIIQQKPLQARAPKALFLL